MTLGGKFVNAEGERFMPAYDRELGDFASMSSVAAASAMEVRAGRGPVYLDMTHFKPEDIQKLKITIPHATMILERAGVLVGERFVKKMEWAPAFYATIGTGGGAVTNTRCETSLPGLFACGDARSRPPHFAACRCSIYPGTCIANPDTDQNRMKVHPIMCRRLQAMEVRTGLQTQYLQANAPIAFSHFPDLL